MIQITDKKNKVWYNVPMYSEITQGIEKVFSYLQGEGVDIVHKAGELTRYSHGDGVVYVDSEQAEEEKLYILLHEVGHYEVMSKLGFDLNKIREYYPGYFDADGYMKTEEDFASQMARVHEEMDAWRIGIRMTETLDIDVNMTNFMFLMDRCIQTYIEGVSE